MKNKLSETACKGDLDDYVNLLESMFTEYGKGFALPLFKKFRTELFSLVKQELSFLTSGSYSTTEEAIAIAVKEAIGSSTSVLMAPAGEYALNIGRHLRSAETDIETYLDNYKTGTTPEGVPIVSPEKINNYNSDVILIATPSYGAQKSLRDQFTKLLETEKDIILTGDIVLERFLKKRIEMLDDEVKQTAARLESITDKASGKVIVFAVTAFPAHYAGHIRALRRQGHTVILISLYPDIMYGPAVKTFAGEFDYAVSANHDLLFFFRLISGLKCDTVYTVDHSLFNWFCLMVCDLSKSRSVLEVYDFSDNAGYSKSRGVKNVENDSGIDMWGLEEYARKELYNNIDGIIYRDSPELMEKAKEHYSIKKTPFLRFRPYPENFESLKEKDDNEHIVFSGHILNRPNELVYTVLELAEEVADQGMNMHFFNPADPMANAVDAFVEAAQSNPFIHYHRPMPNDFHNYIMRLFNWGWLVYDFKDQSDEDIRRHSYTFTSRLLSYINAGLPVICSKESTYQVDIIKKYGIGLVIGRDDVKDLKTIVNDADYASLLYNANELKRKWDIDQRIDELVDFMTV